jgi:CBS domain-containing protein
MTGKRKSNDNVRQARRSEADLGQKEAKLEKASEEELRHMGDSDAAASARRQGRSAMKVQIAMHKGVEWVGPDTPVAELAKLMRKHDIGAIPIGENDQLIGMVTDRDIVCKGLAKDSFDARRATARDVMTSGIHCCREDDDLAKAVRHMEELKIRRLPVINKSMRMVGILSLGDVSHAATGDLVSECVKSVSAHHR